MNPWEASCTDGDLQKTWEESGAAESYTPHPTSRRGQGAPQCLKDSWATYHQWLSETAAMEKAAAQDQVR